MFTEIIFLACVLTEAEVIAKDLGSNHFSVRIAAEKRLIKNREILPLLITVRNSDLEVMTRSKRLLNTIHPLWQIPRWWQNVHDEHLKSYGISIPKPGQKFTVESAKSKATDGNYYVSTGWMRYSWVDDNGKKHNTLLGCELWKILEPYGGLDKKNSVIRRPGSKW